MHSQSHQSQSSSSQYSSFSGYTPRSSASTAPTSVSSLGPPPLPTPPPLPPNGTPVQATNSVLNTRGGQESSLFQICLNLRQRLRNVPGFEEILLEEEEDADEDTDPVTLLWRTFRRGYPLMTIYNALNPAVPLVVDESKVKDVKRPQAATFKFLQACLRELRFPAEECFIISDLYGDDTTGFVKVGQSFVNHDYSPTFSQTNSEDCLTRGPGRTRSESCTRHSGPERYHKRRPRRRSKVFRSRIQPQTNAA